MNKFSHPKLHKCKWRDKENNDCLECKDFEHVSKIIQNLLKKICKGILLAQADAWICKQYYTVERLKIKQLLGKPLLMDGCYINLAIIKQPDYDLVRSKEGLGKGDAPPWSSLFSRDTWLNIQTLDKNIQVDLLALFKHEGPDDKTAPRRILIHGRAGVGKMTLCKKIVNEFIHCCIWEGLFDCILWVLLRNLKRKEYQIAGYNFFHLFCHKYFS
jgi:NB-ARC domain